MRLHESGGRGIHHEVKAARMTAVTNAEARPCFTPAVLNDGATSGTTPRHAQATRVEFRPSRFVGLSPSRQNAAIAGGEGTAASGAQYR